MKLLGVALLLWMVAVLLACLHEWVLECFEKKREDGELINWLAWQGILRRGRR